MSTPTTDRAEVGSQPSRWWLWTIPVVGVLALVVVFATTRVATARKAMVARKAVEARNFPAARASLVEWLKSDPNSAEAHYLLARVELASDHPQEAINALGKALDLGYPPDALSPYRAVIQANGDQFDEAEPALRKALADSNEPMPEVAKALARVYLGTFRLKDASGAIARWMRDAPDDPEPYLAQNEVETRSDAGRPVVIANFREALRRAPNHLKARFGLADMLRQEHHLEEAADEFAAYIKSSPGDPEGHLGAGRIALEQGRFDEAATHFDQVLAINPKEPYALKERGSIELRKGNLKLAREFLERAILADPFDPDAHYNLQLVCQRQDDKEGEARHKALAMKLKEDHARINSLKGLLVKTPRDVPLRIQIVEWLLEHGHDAEGIQMADQVLRDAPGQPAMLRLLMDYHGRKGNQGKANYYRLLMKEPAGNPAS